MSRSMHAIFYYREQANRARRLAKQAPDNLAGAFEKAARDYEKLADDLDRSVIVSPYPLN